MENDFIANLNKQHRMNKGKGHLVTTAREGDVTVAVYSDGDTLFVTPIDGPHGRDYIISSESVRAAKRLDADNIDENGVTNPQDLPYPC